MSAALAAAVRWEWIRSNPAEIAKKPKQPAPDPEPPTAAEAARLIEAAWLEDDGWGVLVWLVMFTGMRRAELAALRWSDVDLASLRHYSAIELLTAGVDLRTVAGRLGHGGGGATTLRVYAAFVGASDQRAADILGGRMRRPVRPAE